MNKKHSILPLVTLLLLATALVGCQSPGRNPAGVRGSVGSIDQFDFEFDSLDTAGTVPLTGRFSGGNEYPGMFEPVYFAYDSSQVAGNERAKIEAAAFFLRNDNSKSVIIDGHCDERGSVVYNQNLSEKRALAIRSYLISIGIDGSRIQTRGFGEELPADGNHNESAWSANRRGEFVLYY